jgi:group I intron endonuclease
MLKKNQDILGRIYIIINKINNKVYIGQTISTLSERWSQHKCDSKRKHTAIANAMIKYGVDNFKMDLIEDDIPYIQLDEREIEYIKQYNSICPNGYNITDGGQTYKTDEYREIMSERVMGENNPMFGMYGELNPFYGKEHTQETKELLSEISKNRWSNYTNEEYKNEVKRLAEMNKIMIEKTGGGGFKGKHHSEESINAIKDKMKGREFSEEHKSKISENSYRKQKVVMFDKYTGEYLKEFDSMTIACTWLIENKIHKKPKSGEISNVCRRERKSAYGYAWAYYEDYNSGKYNIKKKQKEEVICLNNSKVFNNIKLAMEYYLIGYSGIWACCNGTQKTSGKLENGTKLKWMYYDDYLELNNEEKEDLKVAN